MKIRSQRITRWLAWGTVRLFQLLFLTCRKIYLAPEPWLHLNHPSTPDDPHGVLCVWHDMLILPTFGAIKRNRRRSCCLVSQHQDGTYLAVSMDLLQYSTVRGSTRRGGAAALKQMLDDTAGKNIVITPDGPSGPRRQLKPGAIYVASQTGRPICAGAYACKSAWRIPGRWTDMVIPKPFTTMYIVTGPPIHVPPDLSRDELNEYVALVQSAMDDLSDQVERLARGEIDAIDFTAVPTSIDAPRQLHACA